MTKSPLTPVIIGVGDVVNKSLKVKDAIEPMQLMLQAISNAITDTGLPSLDLKKLKSSIDSISVVATWTWPYNDLPGILAEKLRAKSIYKKYSEHGGNQPVRLVDEAARRVAYGNTKVAVVTGGEALASRMWHCGLCLPARVRVWQQ